MTRVFVTGLGTISGLGVGRAAFELGFHAGAAPVEPVPEAWQAFYESSAAHWSRLPELDFARFGIRRTERLLLAPPALLGIATAHLALEDAGFSGGDEGGQGVGGPLPLGAGVFIGTGLGAAQAPFDNYLAHTLGGLKRQLESIAGEAPDDRLAHALLAQLGRHPRVNPMVICQTMPNAIAANIAIRSRFEGPCRTVVAACASGTVAIGDAFQAIRRGELTLALAGGVEHLSDNAGGVFMGFDRLQTLARPMGAPGAENRPFDARRSGFLFSEGGAALLVLESEASMQRRGATALAEIIGYAETCDAHSIAALSPEHNAIGRMLHMALADAGIEASDIDYINAHGTGTELNDRVEASLIAEHFGHQPWVNATKSLLGHTIGAAGALECAASVISLHAQLLHGCANLEVPIADLNFCLQTKPTTLDTALSQSFGFGGHNAALVLRRAPEAAAKPRTAPTLAQ